MEGKKTFGGKENPMKQFLDNFIALRNKFEMDPNALNSKYKQGFFTMISTRAFVVLQALKATKPGLAAKFTEYNQFVENIKREKFDKGELASEEDINVADKFLDYLILELQKTS